MGFELTFWIEPRHREEFLQTAESLASESLPAGVSAIRPSFFESVDAKSWFLWRECWDSRAVLEERLQSPGVRTLLGAIEVLGKLEGIEEIELHAASEHGSGGLDDAE